MSEVSSLSRAAIEAYDYLSHPVWVFSTQTLGILRANTAALDWIGYDAQTLQTMTILDLRPEADKPRL
ncbi:MAG: hypothetical protein GW905_07030, partial [Rhodobacterales bacterium]|nr:hypothetical protein [Rhodobacterales bacterium]